MRFFALELSPSIKFIYRFYRRILESTVNFTYDSIIVIIKNFFRARNEIFITFEASLLEKVVNTSKSQ